MFNLMVVYDEGHYRLYLFPRKAHRPACYYRTGEENLLISPATVEMAGLIPLVRLADFEKITADNLAEVYSEISDWHFFE